MDERLEKALDYSNFRMILSTRQTNLKTLMENRLNLSYQGGFFKIDKEMLSFLGVLLINGHTETVVIDVNDIPIKIDDLDDFAKKASETYGNAMEDYYESYKKLDEAREIRKVIDWDEE